MFLEPDRSPYDLSFRLFGFRVRVNPWFWLLAALLGSDLLRIGLLALLMWVAAVFVSILIHELGHGLAFRLFRVDSHIALYAFGGLTVPYSYLSGRWRRALVSLAGPGAGFLFLALLYFSNQATDWASTSRYARLAYLLLCEINLYWGIFNLLPVWPLDGGQFAREVCEAAWRRNGTRIALEISVAAGGSIAIYSLACALKAADRLREFLPTWFPQGSYWTAILFGLLAYQSFQLLQQDRDDGYRWRG